MSITLKLFLHAILISASSLGFADDTDGDGIDDSIDNCPSVSNSDQTDTDSDRIGNACDADDDGDGVSDANDVWPLDHRYSLDSDSDGMPDAYEDTNALNKYVASDANSDSDNDGLTALQEFSSGTSPISKDTDRDTLPDGWEVANGKDPMLPNYLLSVATNAVCLKNDSKIDCWGGMFDIDERLNEIDEEVIKNSTAFPSSGGNFRCLLSDGEIYCNDERQVISDTLPITSIDLGQNTACGINSAGEIKCSGIDGNITAADTTVIESPLSIALGYQFLCGLTSNEVKCAGSLDGHNMPDLVSPYLIDAGDSGICAVDSLGVKCWGDRFGLKDITAPDITNVTDLSVNSNLGCLIDQSEIRCWGNQNTLEGQESPQVVDPVSIGVGTGFACALGNQGIECWGENQYGALTIPSNLMIDPDGDGYSTQGGSDAFPLDSAEWLDTDSDSIGNNADPDDDNDSVLDADDVFPIDASESTDIDGDGVGDNADAFPDDANEAVDSDLDNVGDNADNCVDVTNTDQLNSDDDLLGNACDEDDDNDGVSDELDALPLDATEQIDTDADGIGNNADDDDDNDGVVDNSDAYPLNSLYSADSDGDGMADAWELLYGLDPNDPSDASSDVDNDGAVALQEFIEGTIPSGSLDIDGNENYDALTDGLLLLRGMFGLDGSALVTGTIASDAAYTESVDIESRIEALGELADIDGNGQIDALTDGLLTLRYLFGLQGDTLINGVVADDATRTTAEEIEAHLETLMPAL